MLGSMVWVPCWHVLLRLYQAPSRSVLFIMIALVLAFLVCEFVLHFDCAVQSGRVTLWGVCGGADAESCREFALLL